MTFNLLTKVNYYEFIDDVNLRVSSNENSKIINNLELYNYLSNIKCEIDNIKSEWSKYKKYTNPYEFIHTPLDNSSYSICKYNPLSRSFFKMIELCNVFKILDKLPDKSIKTFHLAEGPGGFIEAIHKLRNNTKDKYYGMTLISDDVNVPGWDKINNFMKDKKNIYIEKGFDNTGNLFNLENLKYCYLKYKNNMNLITADGGFDFSLDYNNQENSISNLLFCQVLYAICLQKKGGVFIIKCFDLFSKFSLDIVYLLSILYEDVWITKPKTSRYGNSEKYIVCNNYCIIPNSIFISKIFEIFSKIKEGYNILSLFDHDISYQYNIKIKESICSLGEVQIDNILNTLNIINNLKKDKLEFLKKNNLKKCTKWCKVNNMEYNNVI